MMQFSLLCCMLAVLGLQLTIQCVALPSFDSGSTLLAHSAGTKTASKGTGDLPSISGGSVAVRNTSEGWTEPYSDYPEPCSDSGTEYVGVCELPTGTGHFKLYSFRQKHLPSGPNPQPLEPVVLVAGDLSKYKGKAVPVRIHDQCLTSEVLGSQRCDCKEQLDLAKEYIQENGGAVIYLQQEGRGIGLANKIAAYELQDGGLDTVDANRALGFDDDHRTYESVPFILRSLGIESIKLMSNNPRKNQFLTDLGVKIEGNVPCRVAPNMHNERYLVAKKERMSHRLPGLEAVHHGGKK
mmetsp:Transcript_25166/g.41604  ORF Transcript_25166/g.41604 Transcript_25166/m.41604 type:complete len:296 (-) Transcript_25166:233-1120(-)